MTDQTIPTRLSAEQFKRMKCVTPIPMLTAYTAPVARELERASVPIILVGDSVGMAEMGFENTRHVTLEHMEYHVGAVRRGAPNTHVIGDLPYQCDATPELAMWSAQRLISAGADSVKLEGAKLDAIAHLTAHGIPVVGHSGLTPQTAENFKQVGRREDDAERLRQDAEAICRAGAFMLVLEHIPQQLARQITQALPVPTIGIGAGPGCDGQVLVINDAIGLGDSWPPSRSNTPTSAGPLTRSRSSSFRT